MDLGEFHATPARCSRPHEGGGYDDGNVMNRKSWSSSTDIEAPEAVDFAKFAVVAMDGTRTTPQVLNAQ